MDNESSRDDKLESILQDGSSEPRSLPLEYLRNITNNFSDGQLLGIGGFGKVYKGTRQNGECIAVKKLDQLKPSIQKPQFENEVYHLMRLKHPNIVRLVGYCYETRNECVFYDGKYVFAEMPQKLVCLEYLPNGSLERHLSDESSGLDWCTRYRIIRGTCFGLHYLHEECKSQLNASIIHLDLKPANILLDDNMVPKIADFGLSKILDMGKTQTHTTFPAGSLGYMAPEYIHQHKISTKADIYSLGVVIIEVITGRMFGPSGIETLFCGDFVEPVLKIWRNRLEATPTCTSLETDCQQIEICLEIGLSCTNFYPEKRPTTMKVIEMLNRCESTNSYESDEERLAANQIRGARPPLLSPPPPIGALAPPPVRRSFVDDYMTASPWDIVQSFAPREGSELGERVDTRCNLDTEEENEAEDGVAAVEGELKIKRKSKSWMLGALLGSGSFGMVYEGINDDDVAAAASGKSIVGACERTWRQLPVKGAGNSKQGYKSVAHLLMDRLKRQAS